MVLGYALAFLSELATLAGVALLAAAAAPSPLRWPAALLAAVAMALAWGRWAAPKSSQRLGGSALLAFKLAAFALGAAGFAAASHPWAATALLASAILGLALTRHDPLIGPDRDRA